MMWGGRARESDSLRQSERARERERARDRERKRESKAKYRILRNKCPPPNKRPPSLFVISNYKESEK